MKRNSISCILLRECDLKFLLPCHTNYHIWKTMQTLFGWAHKTSYWLKYKKKSLLPNHKHFRVSHIHSFCMCINDESRENVIALGSTNIWHFPPEITKTTDKKCVVFRDYSTVRVGQKQMNFLASNVMPESLFSYAVWKRCFEVFPNCWHWQYAVMLDLKISVTNTPSLRM